MVEIKRQHLILTVLIIEEIELQPGIGGFFFFFFSLSLGTPFGAVMLPLVSGFLIASISSTLYNHSIQPNCNDTNKTKDR
jgi:hypothetical protein